VREVENLENEIRKELDNLAKMGAGIKNVPVVMADIKASLALTIISEEAGISEEDMTVRLKRAILENLKGAVKEIKAQREEKKLIVPRVEVKGEHISQG